MTGIPPADGAFPPMPSSGQPGVRIVVCSSCRLPGPLPDPLPGFGDAGPRAGALLARDVKQAAGTSGIAVAQVPCLANCKRSLSASILSANGWSYVFGDLLPTSAADLVEGAKLLRDAPDGLLPWRGRPEPLKRGTVARIPPLSSLEEIVS